MLDLWQCALDLGSVIEYSHPDGGPFDILMTCPWSTFERLSDWNKYEWVSLQIDPYPLLD